MRLQGLVNNAVYQHYLEHSRHEFLKTCGLDFADLARRRIGLVVIRAELDYRQSLGSGERFVVSTRLERISKLRFGFRQQIVRTQDQVVILDALIIGTAVNARKRPFLPKELEEALGPLS
jgi:acyl-CoA thioester hydrolase